MARSEQPVHYQEVPSITEIPDRFYIRRGIFMISFFITPCNRNILRV